MGPNAAPPPYADLLTATEGITPVLRANAVESERLRMLAPASVEAMHGAGLWRVLTPSTHGGDEAGLRAQVDSSFLVSAADSAAGWVHMVSNAHVWMAGNFPAECQSEVFGDGPDVRIPGTLAAQGRATKVDDGWRLNGRWQFASGIDHGNWVLVGAVADVLADSPSRALHLIVPKADLVVDDTWYTLGLRGSGSNDIVAEDVLVPEHRAVPTRLLFDGLSPHGEEHATHANRLPVLVCLAVQFAAAVVGITDGGLELHLERTRVRREVYTGASKAEDPGTQTRIAESATELDMARMLVRGAADRCDLVASTGERLTMDERAELKWQMSYVGELCRRAIERIFASAGAHAVYDDSLLQARFRDVNTACHHAVVDFDSNARMYGRVKLGLDPDTPLI
ncbi:MAG: 3-hydroxy-9,10-secoandrosta-1,3,5(10)-triene-9,17-dione monooxygenase [Acidimicrobiales bacterium]|jgi:alkylation response protein AidB-like acyl-CoA dehydrogenase